MGPIHNTLGVEQGRCASDRLYRLCNNEQLNTAQQSQLGVDLEVDLSVEGKPNRLVFSAVSQTDDVAFMSNLKLLLYLLVLYCNKYQVKLVGSKTKVLVCTF